MTTRSNTGAPVNNEPERAIRAGLRGLAALAIVSTGLWIAGCNTTEGVGRDIESAGDAIEDAASDAKD